MSQISFNPSFPRNTKLTDSHSEKNSFSWLKIDAFGMYFDKENKEAAEKLLEAIELREKYINLLNSKTAGVRSQSPKPGVHSPELPSMRPDHRNSHNHHHAHNSHNSHTPQGSRGFPASTVVTAAAPDPAAEWRRGGGFPAEERESSRPQRVPMRAVPTRDDDGEEDFIGSAPAFRSMASIAERFEAHMQGSAKRATEKVLASIPVTTGSSQAREAGGEGKRESSVGSFDSPEGTFMLSPPLVGKGGKGGPQVEGMTLGRVLDGSEGSPSFEDIEKQLGIGREEEEEEIRAKTEAFTKLLPDYADFIKDKDAILRICTNGPVVSYSRSRLNILDYKFTFYKLLNSEYERVLLKDTPADRTTVARVDTRTITSQFLCILLL